MINDLIAKGLSVDEDRIYGPAGLDIGALQPEEIALSILAEIIAVQRQRQAQSLRTRQEPIHERQTGAKAEII
jgi:xanthine/CO dehydrogenase XdhC/CoxF family maturation factor